MRFALKLCHKWPTEIARTPKANFQKPSGKLAASQLFWSPSAMPYIYSSPSSSHCNTYHARHSKHKSRTFYSIFNSFKIPSRHWPLAYINSRFWSNSAWVYDFDNKQRIFLSINRFLSAMGTRWIFCAIRNEWILDDPNASNCYLSAGLLARIQHVSRRSCD
jgi:hypothetical protein